MSKILIIEDEASIARFIELELKHEGNEVGKALDGRTGLDMALTGEYDLILLDVMLPQLNGFEVCRSIRTKSNVPIIFVTAREEEKDKVLGLETGADDYVTKPFSVRELLSRIKANIRRSSGEMTHETKEKDETTLISVREIIIDCSRYSVRKNGIQVELSKKEYDLLVFFASNPGKIYSREDLLEKIWGYDGYYGDIRTVDVTISRLREKIEDDPAKPQYIMTRRGMGYYFQ